MSNETDICNMALSMLGGEPILNYQADITPRSKWCRSFYPSSRDAVLRSYPWSFAIVRKALVLDPNETVYGFESKFALPDKPYCLRVLGIDDRDHNWRTEGRFLICNLEAVKIKYISRVEDTQLYDPMFVQALSTRLAAVLAKPVTGSTDQALWQLYASMVHEGETMDSMEGTLPGWESNILVDVRR